MTVNKLRTGFHYCKKQNKTKKIEKKKQSSLLDWRSVGKAVSVCLLKYINKCMYTADGRNMPRQEEMK